MISISQFNVFCLAWIGVAIILFPILFRVTQPYGMHTRSGWGPMVSNKLAWFLMELPALAVFLFFALKTHKVVHIIWLIPIALWSLHYVHRSLIYPLRIKTKGKKMPALIMIFGIFFNAVNGFLNGYWLDSYAANQPVTDFDNVRIAIGVSVFLAGFIMNKYHDHLLIKLRKKATNGYKIPYDGLFRYISCPNYLGEIITWLGFFIVCFNLPALSFLVWTMVNLIPRASDHHKWYKGHFEEYPKERMAIFPYVY